MRARPGTLIILAGLAGCAGSSAPAPPPAPEEIPALEAAVEADPDGLESALLLAAAYRAAGRAADAGILLEWVTERHPSSAEAWALAGAVAEAGGAWAEARGHYERAARLASEGPLAEEIANRLEVVRLEELRADVRASLAREAELADRPPDPASVGVFPFAYEGGDPMWEPLGRALAELLITDLGVSGRLRVLERVKVQALVDEMALGESGLVEPATAARSGRILGAGRLVQGRFRVADDRIDVDAALVEVGGAQTPAVRPVEASDLLERLFDMERSLALRLHADLGVQLTPAEEARISERRTANVQALLAFGRGLEALDAGAYEEAEARFAEAAALDPSFSLAAQRRSAARAAAAAGREAMRLQAQATRIAHQRQAVRALRDAPAAARAAMLRHLSDRKRAVLAEVLGQDRIGTAVLLEIVFRRPGGSR